MSETKEMGHRHEIVKCSKCGTVIMQCRCMDKNKPTRYEICEKCRLGTETKDVDYTEIRDDRIRSKICKLMSEMLDNPDENGIYPTSKFMWKMETFILEERAVLSRDIEAISEAVHKAYCRQYEKKHGKPYWTGGDYSKLNEETKEFDRATVRAVLNIIDSQGDRSKG